MSRITTTKFFQEADIKRGEVMTGADAVVVIEGYKGATFDIKTASLPMLKHEKVEYTGTRGVKSGGKGYLQSYNTLNITFLERSGLSSISMLNEILMQDKAPTLKFYTGRTNEESIFYGEMKNCTFVVEDNPELDSESTTSPLMITVSVSGHYFPPAKFGNASDISKEL